MVSHKNPKMFNITTNTLDITPYAQCTDDEQTRKVHGTKIRTNNPS